MGENLVGEAMTEQAFASVRVYDGIEPADQDEIARVTAAGFLPIMRESDGFVGYYLLPAGDQLAAISLFDTPEQAAVSNEKARGFVAENLAPLLPNAPTVVEGMVEVSTQLMFMPVDPNDLSMPLHARLVIYDGFDMARLDETVALVESVLLPQLRDVGVFSYHGISDGVDKAVALRIMDSAESLQRGSDIAADFIAEHIPGWLPEDPLVLEGRLGVAAVGAILQGKNLAESGEDATNVFASVRVYDGIDPADQDEIARLTAAGFLPVMRESDGFVGYFLLSAGDELAAVSMFDSAEQASASNERARDFVVENLAPLLPNAPTIVEGSLSIKHVAALSGSDDLDGSGELYASIRFYEGFDMRHVAEANDLATAHLLPAMQELGGLFAQFALNDGEDTVVGISIFDNEEASLASNEVGKAFTREYIADWAPNPPTGVSGKLGIAALAQINMGENLVGADEAEERAFVSIRVYDGINPDDMDSVVRHSSTGYLPIINTRDDFIAYFQLPSGDRSAAVSIFATAEGARAANAAAADYVTEHMAPILPNPPHIFEGTIDLFSMALLDQMMTLDADDVGSLFGALRMYDNVDLTDRANDVDVVETIFLPIQQEATGFFGYVNMNNGRSSTAALSIFDSEENAQAANAAAADFIAEYFSDSHPEVPLHITGQLGVAALAQIHMGENLVGAMME